MTEYYRAGRKMPSLGEVTGGKPKRLKSNSNGRAGRNAGRSRQQSSAKPVMESGGGMRGPRGMAGGNRGRSNFDAGSLLGNLGVRVGPGMADVIRQRLGGGGGGFSVNPQIMTSPAAGVMAAPPHQPMVPMAPMGSRMSNPFSPPPDMSNPFSPAGGNGIMAPAPSPFRQPQAPFGAFDGGFGGGLMRRPTMPADAGGVGGFDSSLHRMGGGGGAGRMPFGSRDQFNPGINAQVPRMNPMRQPAQPVEWQL